MPSSRIFSKILWSITGIYWCALFVATHIPAKRLPKIKVNDKLEHFTAYLGLGLLLYISLWTSRPTWRRLWLIVLGIGMAYGAIDEWLQAIPFIKRTCSLADWFADVSGLAIAVTLLAYLRFARTKKTPTSAPAPASNGSGIGPVSALQDSAPPDAELNAEKSVT